MSDINNFLIKYNLNKPKIAVVIVGHNPASETYVRNKVKACKKCGFEGVVISPETVTKNELINIIVGLNNTSDIDGYFIQLPVPGLSKEETDEITEYIKPFKDIDGFCYKNLGGVMVGDNNSIVPATPQGIVKLIKEYNIDTRGKHCVIIGRSNIVGKPLASLMVDKNGCDCTVTVIHSHSENIKEICKTADILIAAVGIPNYVTSGMIKEGAVVIDVGINRIEDNSKKSGFKLCGDVDFENVKDKCSFITPVPGGIGPMTIASLMYNSLKVKFKNNENFIKEMKL